MNCERCGSELLETTAGRLYCRDCVVSRTLAKGTCRNRHNWADNNIKIRADAKVRVRCRACDREAKRRFKVVHANDKSAHCPRCGEKYEISASGQRLCRPCQSKFGGRGADARRERSRAQQEWFDWVVVQRVLDGGHPAPGRWLTQAEWFAVFDKAGHLTGCELARMAHSTPRTVERMRRLHKSTKAKAA